MKKKRILFVEDDMQYRESVTKILRNEGYEVTSVGEALEAIEHFSLEKYDLVISDLVMDSIDGVRLLRSIKKMNKSIKTMILTGEPTMDTELESIDIKVDRYLSKEIRVEVLLKYIELLLGDTVGKETSQQSPILMSPIDKISLDISTRTVTKNNIPIELTPKEFGIVKMLLENLGKAVSRYDLIEEVWDVEHENIDTRVIDVHIKAIRRKLKLQSIISIRGFGYKWDV